VNTGRPQFFGGLESMRGVAALLVVLYHIEWQNPLTHRLLIQNSYLMVDLFFVLSGFVICHNYRRLIGTTADIARFMWLRLGRLYPLHLFFLLGFLGIEILKYVGELHFGLIPHQSHAFSVNTPSAFIANLFLLQPFFSFSNKTFNAPSWTIGVECYTYFLFALVALVARGKKEISLVSGLLVLSAAFLLNFFNGGEYARAAAGWTFLRCIFGFFLGVLAYQVYDSHHLKISRWSAGLETGLVVLLAAFLSFKQNPRWDSAVLPIFALLVIAVAASPLKRAHGVISNILNSTPLRWLGKVSYSIYMTHLVVVILMSRTLMLVQRKLTPNIHDTVLTSSIGLVFVLLTIILVLIASRFTYQWIELACQRKFRDFAMKYFTPFQSEMAGKPAPQPR
jgi:peptidoglycan/LPS O-acetylase OafA/YrhL